MARWEEGTAARLSEAALALFSTQGFDATTVDEIASAAGVTARTYFRHFADKEEVLFSGDLAMEQFLVATVTKELDHVEPRDAVMVAVRSLAQGFEPDRSEHVQRIAVLRQNPRLQGRQLVKQERWGAALVKVLEDHGVEPLEARVAVGRAALVFTLAYAAWTSGESAELMATMTVLEKQLG